MPKNSTPDLDDPFDEINRQIDLHDKIRALETTVHNHAVLLVEILEIVGMTSELRDAMRDLDDEMEGESDADTE